MDERRRFNSNERVALYLAADGKCDICGEPLEKGWHADHVHPWSRGGSTDVLNGSALCPTCNLKKGSGFMIPSWTLELRSWQETALAKYRAANKRDFLCEACPGSGKTRFALRVAHEQLARNVVSRVVVVCPTYALKEQWGSAASKVGIELDYNWSNQDGAPEAADEHGMVVTYQQVASAPHLFRKHCGRRTLVVFDEIHHAGDESDWGKSIEFAFESAERRLCISGTPFRSDNQKIPFIAYTSDGLSQSDYAYSYGAAQGDEVCRTVYFPTIEGDLEWFVDGEHVNARFSDIIMDKLSRQRLKTALHADGDYLPDMIRLADERLNELRRSEHPGAGGLIIAIDMSHAKRIADIVQDVTGDVPSVVVSDESQATSDINTFSKGQSKWIIAVKMVSEGVDIPRLRVLVYATNIVTEMFFRQALGRIVRIQERFDNYDAWFYCPADPELKQFAKDIAEERQHQLDLEVSIELARDAAGDETESSPTTYAFASSTAGEAHTVIGGEFYSPEELAEVAAWAQAAGITRVAVEQLARFHRVSTGSLRRDTHKPVSAQRETLVDRKSRLRNTLVKLVNTLAAIKRIPPDEIKTVWRKLSELDRVQVRDCTELQLHNRIKIVDDWIKQVRRA